MKNSKHWVFIINPIAGNGFASKYVAKVKEMIQKQKLNADVVFTERKGHATEITRDYVKKGVTHIIGVGGDGTFSEIVQSLANNKNITFGAIPAGTGNDFIDILGFSDRFSDSDWEILFEENTIKMDVGKCNERYFINGMGLGFDAQVAAENYQPENSRKVKKGSKSKYWWHIIKTLIFYKEKEMRVTIDGQVKETKSFLNTIANGRRLAGGFYLTPDAIANDGLLNVCLIQELQFFARIKELLRVIKQTHTNDDVVNYFTTDKILFEFENEVPAHLDGELYFNSRFEIGIVPSCLNIIYNPYGQHYFNSVAKK